MRIEILKMLPVVPEGTMDKFLFSMKIFLVTSGCGFLQFTIVVTEVTPSHGKDATWFLDNSLSSVH
jgi:hypothetical protein